jgi:hypothetical protein
MAGKSALMIVLLLHRKGLQTLLSLSVDDCLCTVELRSVTVNVFHASKIFFVYGAIKYILDSVQSNIFWT